MDTGIVIDCECCSMQGTSACDDCVVTFLCRTGAGARGEAPSGGGRGAVVIEVDELRTLRRLHAAGLAPDLRHRRSG